MKAVQWESVERTPVELLLRGACASVDPEAFFPGPGEKPNDARAACRRCPVSGACLEYALAIPGLIGVWGGLTSRERSQIRAGGTALDVEERAS